MPSLYEPSLYFEAAQLYFALTFKDRLLLLNVR